MDWARADPHTEIDGAIDRLRDDQRCQVQTSEDAALLELRALVVAAAAHAVVDRCQQTLAEDAEEISRLRRER